MASEDEQGAEVAIAEEVVASIAAIAVAEVDGVAGLAPGLVGGITEMLGAKHTTRGVRVAVGTRETAVDVFLLVDFGVRIPVVAERVQQRVKNAVESMTGLRVVEVNVHVQGVSSLVPTEIPPTRSLG